MKQTILALGLALAASASQAFCGFYVGKADANLFNEASQVIVVRDGEKTVVSMLNDYKGDLKEFAVVVPVPQVLQKGQVNVGEKRIFDRLDAYSAPRLAEYYDPNPCDRRMYEVPTPGCGNVRGARRRTVPKRQGSRRHHRSQLLGGGIRHRDPLCHPVRRPGNLAQAKRLPHPQEFRPGPGSLYPPEHEVLRGQGEPGRTGQDRLPDAAPSAVRLRVGKIHAAHPPRYGQRHRPPGPDRLHADQERPGGDHQLPHREAAGQYGPAHLPQGGQGVPDLLQGPIRHPGQEGGLPGGVHRVFLGHGLVRPLRRRSPEPR